MTAIASFLAILANAWVHLKDELIAHLQRVADAGGEIGVGGEFVFVAEDGVEGKGKDEL